MQKLLLAGALALLFGPAPSIVVAQDDNAGSGDHPHVSQGLVNELRRRLLQRFDENGNDRLDRSERQHALRTLIDFLEQYRGRPVPLSSAPESIRRILELFDKNRDGYLGPKEKHLLRHALHRVIRPHRPKGGDGDRPADGDGERPDRDRPDRPRRPRRPEDGDGERPDRDRPDRDDDPGDKGDRDRGDDAERPKRPKRPKDGDRERPGRDRPDRDDGAGDEGDRDRGDDAERPEREPGDGVPRDLVRQLRRLLLEVFDRNGNHRLDPPERHHAHHAIHGFLRRHHGEEIVIEEAPARLQVILALFDRNQDGKLGPHERRLLHRALHIVLRHRPPKPTDRGDDGQQDDGERDRPIGDSLDDHHEGPRGDRDAEIRPGRPPQPDF